MSTALMTRQAHADTMTQPFNHQAALADLRRLGRTLDRQVTQQTGATTSELDATLHEMQLVHGGIMTHLASSQTSVRLSSLRTRSRLAV